VKEKKSARPHVFHGRTDGKEKRASCRSTKEAPLHQKEKWLGTGCLKRGRGGKKGKRDLCWRKKSGGGQKKKVTLAVVTQPPH